MAIAREAGPVGSIHEVREAGLDREDLLGVYRDMLVTRGVEERGHILYRQGKIPGSFYTGRGNEAAAVGVATAMGPVATGCALTFRIREEARVAVGWFGEGASARGDAHESMTFAGTRKLPVVYVCDNNQWAYSTPTHLEYATEHVADRAQSYGFEGVVVDGTDVLAVYREAKRAIEKAREGGGPTLVESVTLRMEGHAVHDDAFYVPKDMFEEWAKRDPIERFRSWLRENGDFTDEEENEIGSEVKRLLGDAMRRAEESPQPDPADLTEGVYATPEDLDTPHHK